jgi:hypothetical protein
MVLGGTACVHPLQLGRRAPSCDRLADAVTHPFDSSTAATLAGRYRLTLISDWEDEGGKTAVGSLVLQRTDTLHQFYERIFTGRLRRSGNRLLWG